MSKLTDQTRVYALPIPQEVLRAEACKIYVGHRNYIRRRSARLRKKYGLTGYEEIVAQIVLLRAAMRIMRESPLCQEDR